LAARAITSGAYSSTTLVTFPHAGPGKEGARAV
jgi:hypothetical protein